MLAQYLLSTVRTVRQYSIETTEQEQSELGFGMEASFHISHTVL